MREPNQHACSELVFLLSERDRSDYASPLEEKKSIGTFFWELGEARIDHSRRARTDDMCRLVDRPKPWSGVQHGSLSPAAMFVPTTGGSVQPDIYQRSMQRSHDWQAQAPFFFVFWLAIIGLPCMMVSSSWSPNVQIRTVVHGFIISTQNTTNLARTNNTEERTYICTLWINRDMDRMLEGFICRCTGKEG